MAEKTILKLHANGDLEALVPLTKGSAGYKFSGTGIEVPEIITLPPSDYRNYFIEKTVVPGYLSSATGSVVTPANEDDCTSDFIDITGWGTVTVRVWHTGMNGNFSNWTTILLYTSTQAYYDVVYDDGPSYTGDTLFERTITIPEFVSFIRVSTTYFVTEGVDVKISVERGSTTVARHYPALEDLGDWVRDTGNPISLFPQGIAIKGSVIQSQTEV